jgi:hypothetical protein
MSAVLKWLLSFALDYLKLWWQKEEAEAEASRLRTAKALEESAKRVDAAEVRIDAAVPTITPAEITPSGWNSGVGRLAPLLLLVFLCGCPFVRYEYVEGRWPVIEVPDRPGVPEEPAFTIREQIIIGHALKLEAKLLKYNEEAKAHNDRIPPVVRGSP